MRGVSLWQSETDALNAPWANSGVGFQLGGVRGEL
jgi:hypothetical protein